MRSDSFFGLRFFGRLTEKKMRGIFRGVARQCPQVIRNGANIIQYGPQILAINRHGERLARKLSRIRLRMGDVLVVQGDRARVTALERLNTFRILGSIDMKHLHRQRAPLAIAIFGGVLAATALNLLSLPVAMLLVNTLRLL